MTYQELKNILDKEGIGTERNLVLHSESKYGKEWDTVSLYINDMVLYLFPLKERIDSLLKLNDIKANVEVDEEKEVLTIKLEN